MLLIYPPSSALLIGDNAYITHLPLGLAYLSAYLKSKGHECKILDINMKMFHFLGKREQDLWHIKNRPLWETREAFEKKVLPRIRYSIDKWVNYILFYKPDIVGFYLSYSTEFMSIILAKKLKEKGIKIIFGGPGCFHENAKRFSEIADAIVIGEGEITLEELLSNGLQVCKGAYVNGVWGGEREQIPDLDSLPYPDFDDLIGDYKAILGNNTWISTSWVRGCPAKCHFCYDRMYWRGARMRSAESIVGEIEHQQAKYKVFKFNKSDSTLTTSPQQLNEVCDLIISQGLKIDWYSQARPDTYLTKELLNKLHEAGCTGLMFGVESGSQKVVDSMNKHFIVKEAERILKDAKEVGIAPAMTLMVHAPKETWWDFLKTILFILRNRKNIFYYNTAVAGVMPDIDWRDPKYGFHITKTMEKNGYYGWDKPSPFVGRIKKNIIEGMKCLI